MTPGEWVATLLIVRGAPSPELQAALDATAGLPAASLSRDVRLHVLACCWELWTRRLTASDRKAELPTSYTASYGE